MLMLVSFVPSVNTPKGRLTLPPAFSHANRLRCAVLGVFIICVKCKARAISTIDLRCKQAPRGSGTRRPRQTRRQRARSHHSPEFERTLQVRAGPAWVPVHVSGRSTRPPARRGPLSPLSEAVPFGRWNRWDCI